ncbi:penicillin-binding protein [Providencia rettgeri]|nr:penicillin-binding protein [Providencia rettgeri]
MKRILMVAAATLILAGCPSYPPQQPVEQPPIVPIEPQQPEVTPPPPPDKVPTPPKQQTTDWSASITPLVNQMASADGVENGKVLLVDSVKNNTNGSIPVQTVTSVMTTAVENTNRFKVVPASVVSSARKTLGLSQEDSLVTRSKAIGLGRYVQANYVIYSVMSGSNKERRLEMQLMEVQTGEIIWTGKNNIE